MTPVPIAPRLIHTPDNLHIGRQAYQTLDAWRGIASLWVVLYHAGLSVPGFVVVGAAAISQAGYLGVPVFFVISGYCIANAMLSAARRDYPVRVFFQARLRRIYPPYLAVVLLSLAATLAMTYLVPSQAGTSSTLVQLDFFHLPPVAYLATLTLTQVLLHQPMVQAIFWTLNYEVAFYFFVGLLLCLPWRTPRILLNTLHGLTLGATVALIVCPGAPPFPFDFWTQFGLGVLAFDTLRHPQVRFPRLALAGAALGLLAFAATQSYGNRFVADHPPVRIGFLVSLGFTLILLILYRVDTRLERLRPIRLLSELGGFSYSLYLIHPLVIGAVLFGWRLWVSPKGNVLSVGIEVAAALVVARLFFVCVERPFLPRARPPAVTARLPDGVPEILPNSLP